MLKRWWLFAAVSLFCAGCGDGYNAAKCRQAVVEKYGAEVQALPNNKYHLLARSTNGAIWYVECMGSEAKPTTEAMMFGPQN
jgi:hypothetical protein